jgi:hypothetical protein
MESTCATTSGGHAAAVGHRRELDALMRSTLAGGCTG